MSYIEYVLFNLVKVDGLVSTIVPLWHYPIIRAHPIRVVAFDIYWGLMDPNESLNYTGKLLIRQNSNDKYVWLYYKGRDYESERDVKY